MPRYRRSPEEMMADLKAKIAELEKKSESRKFSQDPGVKAMRMARMHLRKAVRVSKVDRPFSSGFLDKASGFLSSLDETMLAFGGRRARRKRRAGAES